MIELEGVCKDYGEVKAVQNISFKAQKGQIFGLLGPNGAGKSTTIRMIINILAPDSGRILFNGKHMEEKDKDIIGYLPEERGLYKKLTVKDVLLYFADLKNYPKDKALANIDYWLDRFDLIHAKDVKVSELSKGMSQKVQFIGAVVHDPEICFFDEPFSGLDPVSSDELCRAIQELGRKDKIILFSTHIMDQAEKICNKILILNKGTEVLNGELADIKSKFGKNSVVVEFDGDGSFIEKLPYVNSAIAYPRYLEVDLKDEKSINTLLKDCIEKISITKFELQNPSLHKIFVDLLGKGADYE